MYPTTNTNLIEVQALELVWKPFCELQREAARILREECSQKTMGALQSSRDG